MRGMQIHFLGGATTVTGSQFLLSTDRAQVLIDCGMFQGSPNESVRNRIPFGFDPAELDAVVLTHAHLDHCGLPAAARQGRLPGPDPRDGRDRRAGDARAARLGPPARGVRQARGALGEAPPATSRGRRPSRGGGLPGGGRPCRCGRFGGGRRRDGRRPRPSSGRGGRRPASTSRPTIEPSSPSPPHAWPRDPEAELRPQPPAIDIDLDAAAVHGQGRGTDARAFPADRLRRGARGRAGRLGDVPRCRPHPRLGDHPAARPGPRRRGARHRLLGRPRPARDADHPRPDLSDRRGLRPRRVDVRWPRTRTAGRGHPDPGRDGPPRRRGRMACCSCRRSRSAGRRRSCGSSTGSSSAARSRCCRSTSTRRWPSKASDIYRRHPEYYDEETARLLREGDTPLDYPNADRHQRRRRRRRRSSARRGRT